MVWRFKIPFYPLILAIMLRKIIKKGIFVGIFFSFSTFNPYTLRITYKPYMFLKVQILEFEIRQPKM